MRPSRLFFFLSACLLGSATASCNGCSKKGPDLSAPVVETPVAAPASLLAEAVIENPDAFWGKLQKGMGGLAGLMPASAGGLLVAATSVDAAIGPVVDGASPAYGACIGTTQSSRWALALRLTDLPHARQALFDGPAAKYDPAEDGDFVLLMPKAPPPKPSSFTIAISKTGYVVVAQTKADIDEVGPYLVRTMPTHPRATTDATLDVPHAALAGPIHDGLMERWKAERDELTVSAAEETDAHGREADLADPAGILAASDHAMQTRLAALADVAGIHVTLTATGDLLDAEAILTPGDANGAAAQWLATTTRGELAPLLDAPQAYGSLLWHTSDADRTSLPVDGEALLSQVLGSHLDAAQRAAARQAMTDWAAGVGDHTVVSASTAPVFAVRLSTPTTHPDAIAKGVHEGLDLVKKAIEAGTFKRFLGDAKVSFGTEDVVGVGKTSTMKVDRYDGEDFSSAWVVQNGVFKLVFAADASAALGAQTEKTALWKEDERISTRATALGSNVSIALASKPSAADANAFAFVTFGLDGNRGKATLAVSDVLLRERLGDLAK